MARSRKDGRRHGNHRGGGSQGKEYWSARWRGASGSRWGDGDAKRGTHRHERRQGKAECAEAA
jgi:hypothetical protein